MLRAKKTEADMKVLITGGMGVIGAETSRKFVREGHRPVVFARHRDESLIGDIIDKIDFEQGDVLDLPRILQAIKKHQVTHVVHAAAFVGAAVGGIGGLAGGLDAQQAMVGSIALGLFAWAVVGIGFAVGGLFRTSLAAEIAAVFVVATYLIDLVARGLVECDGPPSLDASYRAPRT